MYYIKSQADHTCGMNYLIIKFTCVDKVNNLGKMTGLFRRFYNFIYKSRQISIIFFSFC